MPLLDQPSGRLLLVALLLVVTSIALRLARRRDGVFRSDRPGPATVTPTPAPTPTAGPATAATAPPGDRASAADENPRTGPDDGAGPAAVRLTADDLGRPLGKLATLVQLSSAGCASCPQVRRVLTALVAGRPGVVHVEIDASQRLDLARRLNVLRTPTVLVLGPSGDVRSRATGRLDPAAAAAALDAVSPAPAHAAPTLLGATLVRPAEPALVDTLEVARA